MENILPPKGGFGDRNLVSVMTVCLVWDPCLLSCGGLHSAHIYGRSHCKSVLQGHPEFI